MEAGSQPGPFTGWSRQSPDVSTASDAEGIAMPATAAVKGLAAPGVHAPLPLFGLDEEGPSGKTPLHHESGPGTSSSGSHSSSSNALVAGLRAPGATDPRAESQSRTNLFVSNVPHSFGKSELMGLFSPYGEILSAAVMRNIHTGDSLGTAFVRFATTEQAREAMERLTGHVLEGRSIVVQWARRQHDDTPVGEARKKIVKLFVRNIPMDVGEGDLVKMFSEFGPVKGVSLHKDTTPSTSRQQERRIAFITFHTDGVAERAAEAVHNTRPFESCGKVPLMVKLAEDNPKHGRGQGGSSGRGGWGRNQGSDSSSTTNRSSLNSGGANGSVRGNKSQGIGVHGSTVDGRPFTTELPAALPGFFPVSADACGFPAGAFAVFPTIIPQGGAFMPPPMFNVGVGMGGQAMALQPPMFWQQAPAIPVDVMGQGQSGDVGTAYVPQQQAFAPMMEGSSDHHVDLFSGMGPPPPFPTDPVTGPADFTGFSLVSPSRFLGAMDTAEAPNDACQTGGDVYDGDLSLSLDFLGNLGAVQADHMEDTVADEDTQRTEGSFKPFP